MGFGHLQTELFRWLKKICILINLLRWQAELIMLLN